MRAEGRPGKNTISNSAFDEPEHVPARQFAIFELSLRA